MSRASFSPGRVAPMEGGQTSRENSYTQTLGSEGGKRAATASGRGKNWGASTWGLNDGRHDSSSSVGDSRRCPRVQAIKRVAIGRRPRRPSASSTTTTWRCRTYGRRTGRKRPSERGSTGPCSPFKTPVIWSTQASGKPQDWGSYPYRKGSEWRRSTPEASSCRAAWRSRPQVYREGSWIKRSAPARR